jgi:thiamine kinase-like enzyme
VQVKNSEISSESSWG